MNYKLKKMIAAAASLTLMLSLASCSALKTQNNANNADKIQGSATYAQNDTSEKTEDKNTSDETEQKSDGAFTDRDKDSSYDETGAVKITLSDGSITVSGSGATADGNTVTITAEGTYIVTGTLSNGSVVIDTDKNAKVQLVLDGVNISNSSTAPLYIKSTDKVFITLADGSENNLVNTGSFVSIDENNIDACIFSKEDMTFNGGGTLNVSSQLGHGIVSKDSLVFTSGVYNISAGDHGLTGKDDISIFDGTFSITSKNDGLHSNNDDDDSLGNIYIEGGVITISAGDDGMHASNTLTVRGGNITVTESYEGLEGNVVNIYGGNICVRASDDGVNAAGGNDSSGFGGFGGDMFGSDASAEINISGGILTVNADGDGIDSNGAINVSGGEVYVSGPTNNGNGALDTGISAAVSGGTVIAAGSTGMAVNFDSTSSQCSMLISFSGSAGQELTVKNSSGNVIARFTPEKSYECVVISSPELTVGETYTVEAGSNSVRVELTSSILSQVASMGMGGPGQRGGGNMSGFGRR